MSKKRSEKTMMKTLCHRSGRSETKTADSRVSAANALICLPKLCRSENAEFPIYFYSESVKPKTNFPGFKEPRPPFLCCQGTQPRVVAQGARPPASMAKRFTFAVQGSANRCRLQHWRGTRRLGTWQPQKLGQYNHPFHCLVGN